MPLDIKYLSPAAISVKDLKAQNMTGLNLKYDQLDLDEIRLVQCFIRIVLKVCQLLLHYTTPAARDKTCVEENLPFTKLRSNCKVT